MFALIGNLLKGSTEVLTNIGSSVSLPCNISSSMMKPVTLVMWFKGDTEDPFYSLDMRVKGKQTKAVGKHWAHKLWRNKASYNYKEVIYIICTIGIGVFANKTLAQYLKLTDIPSS